MPKQIIEINPFHGGLNNNGDPRDIKVEELSQAQDIMIDEIGKVRTMGSHVSAHANKTVTISDGYGLFAFSHDRTGAEDSGSAENATGENYLALANADGDADIEIYSETDGWSSSGIVDLGSTPGMKAVYYIADGNLRVADANFGVNNRPQWYGYINRYFYGDGSTGYGTGEAENGWIVNTWHTGNASLEPLKVQRVMGHFGSSQAPDTTEPVTIDVDGGSLSYRDCSGAAKPKSENDAVLLKVTWDDTYDRINDTSSTPGGFDSFCSVGDTLIFHGSTANDNVMFTAKTVTDDVIVFNEAVTGNEVDDTPYCYNLSKSLWFNSEYPNFEFAMSTLYDDEKQESPLFICEDIRS